MRFNRHVILQVFIVLLLVYHQMNGLRDLTGTQWPNMKIMRTVYLMRVNQILTDELNIDFSKHCIQCVVLGIFEQALTVENDKVVVTNMAYVMVYDPE
ncbi:MAG TPA: hypothetical protein DGB85_11145 [Deltaproteobacteria bacterium]|nr:hypothetical protein [Deltaproteobacteria bacterium]